VTCGILKELASNGGPEFIAHRTRIFSRTGVFIITCHQSCSPNAGLRVKTVKGPIMDNTSKNDDLSTDAIERTMLQYRNTPDRREKTTQPNVCLAGK